MKNITEYYLENDYLKISLINLGGCFTSIKVKNNNLWEEIILNYSELYEYKNNDLFLGCFIGRIAGRIAKTKFKLNKKEINFIPNEKNNLLHSGPKGLHTKYFNVKKENSEKLILTTEILEADDNINGNIDIEITIELMKNRIKITYNAISDNDTILNLTNHTYWNLNSDKQKNILNHKIILENSRYLVLNKNSIPTKEIIELELNDKIENIFKIENFKNGIDHFFETTNKKATLENEKILINFETTEPGFVVYTGNNIKQTKTKNNIILDKYSGICFEDQNYQDAINNNFSNWVLKKGEQYKKISNWEIKVK